MKCKHCDHTEGWHSPGTCLFWIFSTPSRRLLPRLLGRRTRGHFCECPGYEELAA